MQAGSVQEILGEGNVQHALDAEFVEAIGRVRREKNFVKRARLQKACDLPQKTCQ
jgi:hypothetical protein